MQLARKIMNKKHKNHNFTDVQTSERTVIMKKYTKLIALVLSVILGVSACCFNSFALNDKMVYDMGNGLILTAGYGKPFATCADTQTSFSRVLVGNSPETAGVLVENLRLSSNQHTVNVIFSTAPGVEISFLILDETTGQAHGNTGGFLPAVSGKYTDYSFSGLNGGHEYTIKVQSPVSFRASGLVIAFDD